MISKGMAAAVSALAVLGCTNLERSRDTANANVNGRVLAEQVCSNCHGVTGDSVSPNFPKLAGQQAEYFAVQLKAFRGHHRADPAGFEYMWGLSRHLSDEQIQQLAGYYAAQNAPAGKMSSDPNVARGRQLFHEGRADAGVPACQGCHGDRGQGNGVIPRIAGQHADYVIKQLDVFQRTDERPDGAVMKVVAHGLTGGDMHAVANYVEQLPLETSPH